MSVSVLVPWRPAGPERAAAWEFVRAWWATHLPDWQLVTGTCPPGPWCKADAVADALAQADGRILVVADADVLPSLPHLRTAVSILEGPGRVYQWGMPHRRVCRLTAAGTAQVLAGGEWPEPRRTSSSPTQTRTATALIEQAHPAVRGGGLVVIRRDLYEAVPLDPRFVGWGQEDASWGAALNVIAGLPLLADTHLWHLWHPRPAYGTPERLSRAVGTTEGLALHRRYLAASTIGEMQALLAEFAAPG